MNSRFASLASRLATPIAAALFATLAAASAQANDWGNFAIISNTMGNHAGRLCVGEGLRVSDIGCPTYAPSITTAGDVSITGNVSANKFIGDGSGLTGVTAGSSDRIVSGSAGGTRMVAISDTDYISVTQAGANTAWFDPYYGLIALGVSTTGGISGSTGYFRGNVGIGTTSTFNGAVLGLSRSVASTGSAFLAPNVFLSLKNTNSTAGNGAYIQNADSANHGNAYIGFVNIDHNYAGAITFGTADTGATQYGERMRIAPSGNVGIATTTPAATLQVSGSFIVSTTGQNTTPSLYVGTDGRVGIGTSSPSSTLQVLTTNNINSGSNLSNGIGGIAIRDTSTIGLLIDTNQIEQISSTNALYLNYNSAASTIINYGGGNTLINPVTGKVGIGRAIPIANLDVNGTISASDAIQVGQSALACGTQISGSIRYNVTSDTIQVCTGSSGWKSLSSGTVASTALGDRITSGTVSVTVNPNGYVSLSTGVTTWGYLNSLASYLPQLTSVQVSASNVSTTTADWSGEPFSGLVGYGGNAIVSATTSVSASSDNTIKLATNNALRVLVADQGVSITGTLSTTALYVNGVAITGGGASQWTTTGSDIYYNAGNVGIGTTAPANPLHVESTSAGYLGLFKNADPALYAGMRIHNSAGTGLTLLTYGPSYVAGTVMSMGANSAVVLSGASAPFGLAANDGQPLLLGQVSNERMRITSSGNVGVGTVSPQSRLNVVGSSGIAVGAALTGDNAFVPAAAGLVFSGGSQAGVSTYTSPGNATTIGSMSYYADSSDGFKRYFDIAALGSTGGALANIRFLTGAGTATEKMRIDGIGNVGIGTTAPAEILHVRKDSTGDTGLVLQNRSGSGSPEIGVKFVTGSLDLADNRFAEISSLGSGSNILLFKTGNGAPSQERMRISPVGNVGIGTAVPYSRLGLVGDVGAYSSAATSGGSPIGASIYLGDNNFNSSGFYNSAPGLSAIFDSDGNVAGALAFYSYNGIANSRAERMRITYLGNVGIGITAPTHILHISGQGRSTNSAWATSSDRRVKENIHTIEGGLATVEKLRPVSFFYTKEYQAGNMSLAGIRRGFIAQEVEQVIPDAVTRGEENVGIRKIEDFRILGNSDFVPLLVSAVKEINANLVSETTHLNAVVKQQGREISELKTMVKAIQTR